MLYQLRTGDVILCENKKLNQANAYLIVYDIDNGFGLWCLGCGEALGFYGDDIEQMRADILDKDFLNVQSVIPKELISNYLNSQCTKQVSQTLKMQTNHGNRLSICRKKRHASGLRLRMLGRSGCRR